MHVIETRIKNEMISRTQIPKFSKNSIFQKFDKRSRILLPRYDRGFESPIAGRTFNLS